MTEALIVMVIWWLVHIIIGLSGIAIAVSSIIIARNSGRMVRLTRREDMAASSGERRRRQGE